MLGKRFKITFRRVNEWAVQMHALVKIIGCWDQKWCRDRSHSVVYFLELALEGNLYICTSDGRKENEMTMRGHQGPLGSYRMVSQHHNIK